jgi:type IV pilus assembly protein PilA
MQKKYPLGFSLIELMIVVTIVGILAVIAIPSYQNYTQRARFAEVMGAVAPFKIAISLALQQGSEPLQLKNGVQGIPVSVAETKNLASILVENGIITATATSLINNATLILRPNSDGSLWTIDSHSTCQTAGLCNN